MLKKVMSKIEVLVLLIISTWTEVNSLSLEDCFRNDSISCVQMQVFKAAKNIFGRSTIEIGAGVSVTNREHGKSFEDLEMEERIISAEHVEQRQIALEDYLTKQVKYLWNKGSIAWNPKQTARSLGSSLISEVKSDFISSIGEARGKAKKRQKMILPLLVALKFKLVSFAALAYVIIGVIAKKAMVTGIVSLLISGFIALKNILDAKRNPENFASYSGEYGQPSFWTSGMHYPLYEQDIEGSSNHEVYERKSEKPTKEK